MADYMVRLCSERLIFLFVEISTLVITVFLNKIGSKVLTKSSSCCGTSSVKSDPNTLLQRFLFFTSILLLSGFLFTKLNHASV